MPRLSHKAIFGEVADRAARKSHGGYLRHDPADRRQASAKAFTDHLDFENAVCIILDIDLGVVSGIELRHRLKAASISVPVIYMTGNDNTAVRTAAHQSGCLAYLTKPFSARSLIEPLERATAAI